MSGFWTTVTRGEALRVGRKDGGIIVGVLFIAAMFKFIFRFFSGRPIRGDRHRKTDAEFFRAGTRKLHMNDRTPGRWAYLPEWKRAAIRCAVLHLVVVMVWAWFAGPPAAEVAPDAWWMDHFEFFGSITQTVMTLLAGALVFATMWWAIVRIDTNVRDAKHNRTLLKPFKQAVAPILGIADRDVKVIIPRDAMTGGKK
ncbi:MULTISPECIES: hypothetical protein [unclassified Pseudonocardia]|uniref:hypothetical protein n=1 Tax=unclassified Pseudonocardia TaxID=2619320 RepID=UPI00095C4410|nr:MULTISPECIES: hypothetical protein [unclassified Pseudonocardia]OLL89552.1 hypothetical protein Ae331Ps2_6226c [Pseudonocardia sp. Ae331_Ps2]OLM08322.1 hypothetical protein Ae505Ps2_6226 [Pseudonocardia sp. Ae505_Ps2]